MALSGTHQAYPERRATSAQNHSHSGADESRISPSIGGEDHGKAQDGPQPSSIPPGQAALNLYSHRTCGSLRPTAKMFCRQRDPLSGVSGRDDQIPADGNTQTRSVSAEPYPTTYGMTKRPAAKIPGAK